MYFVFLYGPPGVGKLSVAAELARLTGFKVFHDQLTVNLANALFPRNSDPWEGLVHGIRRETFTHVAQEGVSVVFSNSWRGMPDHVANIPIILDPIRRAGGTVVFVKLTCTREELFARFQNPSRRELDKRTDPAVLTNMLDQWDFFKTLPFDPTLEINSTAMQPVEVAAQIVAHYELPLLDAPALS